MVIGCTREDFLEWPSTYPNVTCGPPEARHCERNRMDGLGMVVVNAVNTSR